MIIPNQGFPKYPKPSDVPSKFHRIFKQLPQLPLLLLNLHTQARRQHQHPLLRDRPLHQPLHIRALEPQPLQPPRLISHIDQELRQRLREHLPRTLPLHTARVHPERLGSDKVPVRIAGSREPEHRRGGDGDTDAVRDERRIGHVAPMAVLGRVLRGDRVAHPVAEVDACVAETDPGQRGGEEHLALGLEIIRVLGGAG